MTSICVNMSQATNEISSRLATTLALGYQPPSDLTTSMSMPRNESKVPLEKAVTTKRCVDFVCLLPYEIVATILQYLTTDELLEYMDVNRGWREQITSIPELWHEVTIAKGEYALIPKLSSIGMYIRKYNICDGDEKAIEGSLAQMKAGYLNGIESLTWENCVCTHRNILDSIHYLRNTLKELTLTANWEPAEHSDAYALPSLSTILSACPGLKRLNVAFPISDIQISDSRPAVPGNLALTHLNWTTGLLPNDAEINSVIDASPKLQYLQVGTYETSTPILEIRKRCPHLRYLSMGDVEACLPNDEFWNYDDTSTVDGLRALSMLCTTEHSWNEVKEVLSMDQSVLQTLTLYHGPQMSIDADYLIRYFRGKQLNLHATYAAWRYRAQVDAIISGSENGKTAAGPAPPRLYNITSTFELGDERGVLGFINALRTGTTAIDDTVSRLRFWKCPGSAILLPLLLDLPCRLQSLQFEDCEFSTTILVGFLRSLKTSPVPTLQELGFFSIPCFTDNLVSEIAGIPGLKTVNLWNCVDITDEGVHSLIDGSTDLEVVDIGGCKQVTDEAIRYVQDILDARKAL